ncbi:MAG: RIP metalloprotease RseP [Alphaproteobacteria bacterium]|jgi:regulator of sigma E protease|nr:RIP metalloprotease RseP [Alphaproteobacteria bacterium]
MDILSPLTDYIIPFLVVLGVLVFVHEWGHYWVARRNGVKIDVFSIGFGPEIFGWNDKAGTRWKVSALPLGGYVKMFGDADAASTPDNAMGPLTAEEKAQAFQHKRLGQRAAIVAAGPAANFLFAVVVLAGLFMTAGHPFPAATVGDVMAGSAAERAGLQPGDEIESVNGREVQRFAEVSVLVRQSDGGPLNLIVSRDGQDVAVRAEPTVQAVETVDGQTVEVPVLGIAADTDVRGPIAAVGLAVDETVSLTWFTLATIGEMIVGERGTEDIGGPIRIAQMSGTVAQIGLVALVWFMAVLSINLGLINLFPIPMLDGGHLLFYAVEAVRGRPLGERAQEYGFRIGLALVLMLMVFATWNDLVHLEVVDYIRDVIS